MESLEKAMDDVALVLNAISNKPIEVEVFASAFVFLKENPDATILDALFNGYTEWCK
jgi:hypothetical protein